MNQRQVGFGVALAALLAVLGPWDVVAAQLSYLETDALPTYGITGTGFTVECLVKVRSIPNNPEGADNPRILRCLSPSATLPTCGGSLQDLWELHFCYENCGGAMVTFVTMSAGICSETRAPWPMGEANGWHHLAATYDGTTQRVYIDGVLLGSQTCAAGFANVTGGKLRVGDPKRAASPPDIAAPFDGQIDEIRIWKVVRTQAEIEANRAAEIPVQPNLVAYWRLNGSGADLVSGQLLTPTGDVSYVPTFLSLGVDISSPGYGIANAGTAANICEPGGGPQAPPTGNSELWPAADPPVRIRGPVGR
jgi:hypothetical protein